MCFFYLYSQELGGILKSLEDSLAEVQRVDAKAQSSLDVKKQNLKDETKKRKDLVKNMEEVRGQRPGVRGQRLEARG